MTTAAPPAPDAAQVTVRFVTKLPPEYRVAEDPVVSVWACVCGGEGDEGGRPRRRKQARIRAHLAADPSPTSQTVPTSLARHGLSQVVNHLLATTAPVPFDFLVDGCLVRGPLDAALRARSVSAETVVALEYILAVPPPTPHPPAAADDWVTSLSASTAGVIAGGADGAVRVWRTATLAAGAGADAVAAVRHAAGVDAVAWLTGARFASAGRDGVMRVSEAPGALGGARGGPGAVLAAGRGHADSVASLAPSPDGARLASGGWDGAIKLWTVDDDALAGGVAAVAPKKRRGGDTDADASAPASLSPVDTLEGHSQCVAASAWPAPTSLATGSWDGAVRWWDAGRGVTTDTLHAGAAVFALAASPSSDGASILAFGGASTSVKLWDARAPAPGAAPGAATLGAHTDWVAALAWHPSSSHTLASASHDGSARLWDARGRGVPLASLAAHAGKALAVAWCGHRTLVSGGADGRVRSWGVDV